MLACGCSIPHPHSPQSVCSSQTAFGLAQKLTPAFCLSKDLPSRYRGGARGRVGEGRPGQQPEGLDHLPAMLQGLALPGPAEHVTAASPHPAVSPAWLATGSWAVGKEQKTALNSFL